MKILFHGASVTAQNKEGSYVTLLSDILKNNSDYIIDKKGYGGAHFNTAGVLTYADDIKNKPDVCFFDWNVTGLDRFSENDISYVVGSSLDYGVLPVFLIFGRRDNLNANRFCDDQIKLFCDSHRVPLIDLRPFVDPNFHLRDIVHTTHQGGLLYSNKIFDFIKNLDCACLFDLILKKHYVKYKIDCQRLLDITVHEAQIFTVVLSHVLYNSRVIIETVHGPESPIIEVLPSGKRIQIWDQWSHFERPGFVEIWRATNELDRIILKVNVLADPIDYDKCNRTFIFSGIKKLVINGVYGVDCCIDSFYCDA